MAYSRCALTNAILRGKHISFIRHVNVLFIKYSIVLVLLAAVRTFAEGVNAEFTVMPRPLICSYFCIDSPPPLREGQDEDREGLFFINDGFLYAFNLRSHVQDQLSTC